MNWRGRRGRPASGMPQATSESKVRQDWYADRLRRARMAIEEALKEIDGVELTAEGSQEDADSALKTIGKVAAILRIALDAEKRDAVR